jgi:hypothetical protein
LEAPASKVQVLDDGTRVSSPNIGLPADLLLPQHQLERLSRSGRGTDEAFAQVRLLTRIQKTTLIEVCQRIVDDAVVAAGE